VLAGTHGEKKGLTGTTIQAPEISRNQGLMYGLLSQLKATAPTVVKFEIERRPVLADILNTANQDVGEVLSPQVALELKETVPLGLNRAEQPIYFDVVNLTRNVAEEQVGVGQSDFGESREAEGDDYDPDDGGERDDEY
jgi:hypothetical protein